MQLHKMEAWKDKYQDVTKNFHTLEVVCAVIGVEDEGEQKKKKKEEKDY